ncbi:glycosyltransferase [Novosphingobium sp. FSW06-99]|uniref:glycosyltransferase n=1 Tax=Novosphingobium sp. FSW06-99 TaxID=1739113 RepID=UPI0018D25750|nr:glycosyltransferase [Novosphingobium sp. FSW06-99]
MNPGDAISETLLADVAAIDRLRRQQRRNLDVQIFCMESWCEDTRIHVTRDWRNVLADEHFRTSDVYCFHFGIYSDMHHLMHHVRRDAKVVVFFHNITQPQYCAATDEALIHASYRQIRNFRTADLVLTASAFSARQLAGYDLDRPVTVVPLFGPNAPDAPVEAPHPIDTDRPLHLLYCGRFVSSKGVATLIDALNALGTSLPHPIELTLAGQTQYSDADYIDTLRIEAARLPATTTVRFAFDLEPDAIRPLFAQADAFVLPSLHEGFGMTVTEALIAGTPVVCSDAGALPEVAGGFALTFPAGDAAELARVLQDFVVSHGTGMIACDRGVFPPEDWHVMATDHARTYTRESYVNRMVEHFDTLLQPTASWDETMRQALADAQTYVPGATMAHRFDQAVLGAVVGQAAQAHADQRRTRRQPVVPVPSPDRSFAQSTAGASTHHAVDTLCVDLQIEDRRTPLRWLGPAHGRLRRALRFARELASKRAYVFGPARGPIAKGNAARNCRNWPEAITHYTKALDINPKLGGIWVQLGHAYKEAGAFSDAEAAYGRATHLMPFNSDLYLQIGHLNKLRGDLDQTTHCYRRSLVYDKSNVHAKRELENLGLSEDVVRIQLFHG